MIDTHVHLTDRRYDNKEEIVQNYLNENINLVINNGYDIASSKEGANLSKQFDSVFFTAGIHPSDEQLATKENIEILKELAKEQKCVAIGEIGLDYHYEGFSKEGQHNAFLMQLELAYSLNLPITIHSRDCTKDMIEFLSSHKNLLNNGAVMHCFSGSLETAKILLNMGLYISFSGTLTFKNARELLDVASFVPLDRFLLETDCPYLTPHPHRGKCNEPKMVKLVYEKFAQIRNLELKEVEELVNNNSKTLFRRLNGKNI